MKTDESDEQYILYIFHHCAAIMMNLTSFLTYMYPWSEKKNIFALYTSIILPTSYSYIDQSGFSTKRLRSLVFVQYQIITQKT